MKILHILGPVNLPRQPEESPISGIVNAALAIARQQVIIGHDVTVMKVGLETWVEYWQGVRLVSLPRWKYGILKRGDQILDLRGHAALLVYTTLHRFDIIHGHLYSYMRGLPAKAKVVHFHGDPLYKGGSANIDLKSSDITQILKHTRAQIAISQFVYNQLIEAFGTIDTLSVVPNGVDFELFNNCSPPSLKIRDVYGISPQDFVLLYSGAIVIEKGVSTLAKAFALLVEQYPDIHLILAGSADLWMDGLRPNPNNSYETEVRQMLQPWVEQHRVHFLGKVAHKAMPGIYKMANVTIVPSIWEEGFGLSALESLACGTPVIASKVGGLVELINSSNGVLVTPGDIQALSSAIEALYVDRINLFSLSSNALSSIAHLSWKHCADAIMNIYKVII